MPHWCQMRCYGKADSESKSRSSKLLGLFFIQILIILHIPELFFQYAFIKYIPGRKFTILRSIDLISGTIAEVQINSPIVLYNFNCPVPC